MTRPALFENNQWLGDKRTQVIHDLDGAGVSCAIDDLLALEQVAALGPDCLAEPCNRSNRERLCTGVRP